MPILGVIASGISGQLNVWEPQGGYDALASINLSATTASITFAGIPSGYKHLQVRAHHLYSNTGGNLIATLNSGSFVNSHYMYGNGANPVTSGRDTNSIISFQSGTTSTAFCEGIWDFLDYNSSSKTKVVRGLVGQDVSGGGIVGIISALSTSLDPITSITFAYNSGSFIAKTRFALYGVK